MIAVSDFIRYFSEKCSTVPDPVIIYQSKPETGNNKSKTTGDFDESL